MLHIEKNMEIYVINKTEDRPRYIIKVHRNWKYGPRAKFWDIQEWKETEAGGYWGNACRGGLAYTEWGMWRAINKRLRKMSMGNSKQYYNLDKSIYNSEI